MVCFCFVFFFGGDGVYHILLVHSSIDGHFASISQLLQILSYKHEDGFVFLVCSYSLNKYPEVR